MADVSQNPRACIFFASFTPSSVETCSAVSTWPTRSDLVPINTIWQHYHHQKILNSLIYLCTWLGLFHFLPPLRLHIVKAVSVHQGECNDHNSGFWQGIDLANMVILWLACCVDTSSIAIRLLLYFVIFYWNKPDSNILSVIINVTMKNIQDCWVVILCKVIISYSLKETCFSNTTITNNH